MVLALVLLIEQAMSRGEQRALVEQAQTANALTHAFEDSVIRSLQAVQATLVNLSEQYESGRIRSETAELMIQQQLRSLPQLRQIDKVSTADAAACGVPTEYIQSAGFYLGTPLPGRYWQQSTPASHYQYWPVCTPIFQQGQVSGFLLGSINLNYYRGLAQAMMSEGIANASIFLYDGSPVFSELNRMPEEVTTRLQGIAWGHYRGGSLEDGEFLSSFRSTSTLPVVVTMTSLNSEALKMWHKDAGVLQWVAGLLAAAILLSAIVVLVLKEKRLQVEGSNRLLSEAIRSTANAIFITDQLGRIHWVNEAFCRLTGYQLWEVKGHTPRVLNSGYHSKQFFQLVWQHILSGQTWRGELINRCKNGSLLTVEQTITPIFNNQNEIEHFIAVHEDVTARKQAEEHALFLAQHDDLTGLANRRYFEEGLSTVFADKGAGSVGVMFIDLDRFKEINDTLGHSAGDALLKRTASQLASLTDDTSMVLARLGGDEFAIFMAPLNESKWSLSMVARQILNKIAVPFRYGNTEFSISCSIGLAKGNVADSSAEALLQQADMAMYRAKKAGKNTFCYFDQSMASQLKRKVSLQQGLEQAIQTGAGLSLRYQPQIDMYSGDVHGAEALLRWCRGPNDWVSPVEFIALAEETGHILALGRWVIDTAFAQMENWHRQGIAFGRISINVSSVQLGRENIADYILAKMAQHGIRPEWLAVEITESTLMVKSRLVNDNLALLNEAGVAIAIDDFGTGYCSLSYLKSIQASYLKLDRSFVIGIGVNESDERIVEATLAMAKGLNLSVVAEGVETIQQLDFLQNRQCQIIQGYYFSKPLVAEDFVTFLQRTRVPQPLRA